MFSLFKKKPADQAQATPTTPVSTTDPAAAGKAPVEQSTAQPTTARPASWRERLSGSTLARSLGGLIRRETPIDANLLDDIETSLLTADVGVAATEEVIADLRRAIEKNELSDASALLARLRGKLVSMLQSASAPLNIDAGPKPFVILTVGVNGVGKTTTIGKLARRYADERKSVILAAGDTFRAAAVEQLQQWGERNQVPVIAQGQGADSAAVIFNAMQAAQSRAADVLIADTAGRLHTQAGLMDELTKVKRVLGKLDASAPHEVLLVIDGTTGQNAVHQVRQFSKAVAVTGLVVTKLDGSAKGGVIFALAREFAIPIRYVGLGEKAHDLRSFDADAFVGALLPDHLLDLPD